MDYEEGEPLSAILQDGETLGEDEVRGLLEDVLPALQAVHDQGFLHRDIKPSNLYVRSSDHRVILIDFGAARGRLAAAARASPAWSHPAIRHLSSTPPAMTATAPGPIFTLWVPCCTAVSPVIPQQKRLSGCWTIRWNQQSGGRWALQHQPAPHD